MPTAATRTDLEIITPGEVGRKQIPRDTTYTWNLKYDTDGPINEQKHRQNSLVARRVGTEGGTQRGLRSADISFYIQNGEPTGSHCTAQRTMFSVWRYAIMEKNIKKRMYVCKWATFLYSRNQYIINQLYFNIKKSNQENKILDSYWVEVRYTWTNLYFLCMPYNRVS